MGMGVTDSPVPVHWVPTPSGPLAWGALPILPFNCTSKETTKVELMSALVEDVNAVGDVVDGDVEDEGAVEDVYPPHRCVYDHSAKREDCRSGCVRL